MLRRRRSSLPSLLDLPHRVYTRSGRSAIALALQITGVRPGERVLVPTYHCPTMIAPVERVGAIPVFYPLDWDGMPKMPPTLETSGIRAMLVPHLFGIPRRLDAIAAYCCKRQVTLIEDCAHCFFGQAGGVPVGVTGDYAIGSLPKFFPVPEGGLLASSRHPIPNDFRPMLDLRSNARAVWDVVDLSTLAGHSGAAGVLSRVAGRLRRHKQSSLRFDDSSTNQPTADEIRSLSMADPLLPPEPIRRTESWLVDHCNLEANIHQRQSNFELFAEKFKGLRGAEALYMGAVSDAAPYVFPLVFVDPESAYRKMRAANLPVFRWDRVWPDTPVAATDAGTHWSRHLIQFACHQSLKSEDIRRITEVVTQCNVTT